MLTLAGIFLVAVCVLVGTYAVMAGRCKEQLAHVKQEVQMEVDGKTKTALELDSQLSRQLAEGGPAATAIDKWQGARGEILQTGKAHRPWAWTSHDLAVWSRERLKESSEETRRRFAIAFVLVTLTVVLVTGGAAAVCYHFYAASKLPGAAGPSATYVGDSFDQLLPLEEPAGPNP